MSPYYAFRCMFVVNGTIPPHREQTEEIVQRRPGLGLGPMRLALSRLLRIRRPTIESGRRSASMGAGAVSTAVSTSPSARDLLASRNEAMLDALIEDETSITYLAQMRDRMQAQSAPENNGVENFNAAA